MIATSSLTHMGQLELTARRQASWSITADRLKARLDSVRRAVFVLSAFGAILAAVASQLAEGSTARSWTAIAGALALAIATFLTARLGTATNVSGWARARAAAEALKREAFRFAAGAAPYDDPASAEDRLSRERSTVEDSVEDLMADVVEADKPGSVPVVKISPDEYIAKRIRAAINGFYRPKAAEFRRAASRLRAVEFTVALIATIVTAAVGFLEGRLVDGFPFDLAAVTAVLTTLGALVLAHMEGARYDFLVTTYRATARRLEDALAALGPMPPVPSPAWSEFVDRCEAIIASENNSWVAKWTGKP